MRKTLFTFFLISSFIKIFAQNNDSNLQLQYNYTEDLVYTEDFSGAIRLYKEMISFDPKNPVFYYKLGFAYLNTFGKQDSAIVYLRRSLQLYNNKYRSEMSPAEVKLYLARSYRLNNDIDSSVLILFELKRENTNPQFLSVIDKEIQLVNQASKLFNHIQDMPNSVNSNYTEHSPVYISDQNILLFTSRKENNISILLSDGQWAENIYATQYVDSAWQEAQIVPELSTETNDATCFFTYDHKELLIYKDDDNGSIYTTTLENGKWKQPEKLPWPINSRFRETHASLTGDGKTIYFTSNRPGGYGGLDIWVSTLDSNQQWSKPQNLGTAVNSKGNEESSNISEDGNTLYFSSNGRNGFGGYDIFKTAKNDFGTWTFAQNLGYPVNSADDDLFFNSYKSQNIAFFSSYRQNSNGRADVFIFDLDTSNIDTKIINFGYLVDQTEKPLIDAQIIIQNDKTSQRFIARPTSTGKFIFLTEPKNIYSISVLYKDNVIFSDHLNVDNFSVTQNFYKKIVVNVQN